MWIKLKKIVKNIKELYNWDNWDIPQETTNMQKDLKPQFMGLCENFEVEFAKLLNNTPTKPS